MKDPKKKPTDFSNAKADAGKKRKYQSPKIVSEDLLAFGALCNGMTGGGRKASTGSPNFCNSGKLLS